MGPLKVSPYLKLYDKLMAIVLAILINLAVTILFDFIQLEVFFWMLVASLISAVPVKKMYLFNSRNYRKRFHDNAEYCRELIKDMLLSGTADAKQ